MNLSLARTAVIAGIALAACGCTSVGPFFHHDDPPALAAAAMADPFATIRPTTASVGVIMPAAADFQHPWDISTYVLRVTQFGQMAPLNGGVAFVGDSLTDWARWNEMFPSQHVRNFGIAGDTTVGLQHRLKQVIEARPAEAFLMIGTNDVEFSRYTPAEIVANVADMVAKLKAAGIAVYVESLLPREPKWDAKVRAMNALLKPAAAMAGVTYIDLYPVFVKDGRLDPHLTPDDIHLAGEGYARWRDILRPFIENN